MPAHVRRRSLQQYRSGHVRCLSILNFFTLGVVIHILSGVSFELARDKKGLTWDVYQRGLGAWRRAKKITIPRGPAPNRQRKLIAYSGISPLWQSLVNKGEGIVETGIPYRWGYAFYAGDIITTYVLFRCHESILIVSAGLNYTRILKGGVLELSARFGSEITNCGATSTRWGSFKFKRSSSC